MQSCGQVIKPKLVWFWPSFPSPFAWFLGIIQWFNGVKSSVSGFIRFQEHLGWRWGLGCKKAHKWEETGHFRHLDIRRSLHGRHGDRGFFKSSEGRHLVATWAPWRQRKLQSISWSPFEVAMATYTCKWRPHMNSNVGIPKWEGSPLGRHLVAMATE